MAADEIPNAFVWTKIQADAGEAIEQILNRKELERQAGDGIFWWGIGESKAQAMNLLAKKQPRPAVLYSLMLSPPHMRDSSPDSVVFWQACETVDGEQPLPPHVIVTSRAHASNGSPKWRHYALVCESPSSIRSNGGGKLDAGALRNIGGNGKSVGSSQVTAVVERCGTTSSSARYEVTARAMLIPPYTLTLTAPRELSATERQILHDVGVEGKRRDDWLAVAKLLRQ